MKIVIFIQSMLAGGAERVTANLANFWVSNGWDVTILTLADKEGDFYYLNESVKRVALNLDGESNMIPVAILNNIRRIFAVRKLLRDSKPDVIVGMMTTAAILSIIAAVGLSIRTIVSERSFPPLLPVGRIWDWLRLMTYPYANQVVMLTEEGLIWLKNRIPEAKGAVIPNSVSYPMARIPPLLLPSSLVAGDRKLILAVGRLDSGKQFDKLLISFTGLAIKYPVWNLVIIGEGPERQKLQNFITESNLDDRAVLAGRVGNIGDWYATADIYVLSSKFEGFPNTLIEAMAYGCPVVSYDCDTGPRDLIQDNVNGVLVRPVGNVRAMADAIEALIVDAEKRRELGEKAKEVRLEYSESVIMERWNSILLTSN